MSRPSPHAPSVTEKTSHLKKRFDEQTNANLLLAARSAPVPTGEIGEDRGEVADAAGGAGALLALSCS